MRRRRNSERGQAQIEAVLTLPLMIFMVLGTIQLFMVLQARILAQYAAYSAARVGALSKGDCTAMSQAASLVLLPTLTNTENAGKLVAAYSGRLKGVAPCPSGACDIPVYKASLDGFDGPIVELVRERPTAGQIQGPGPDDVNFDDFTQPRAYVLELRMAFWYHLRIPFADWVVSRIFMAHYGLIGSPTFNPLMPISNPANDPWNANSRSITDDGYHGPLGARMKSLAGAGHYVVPIIVNATMPMMTPPDKALFAQAQCPI